VSSALAGDKVALLARLRLVAQQRKHLQSITSSKLAVACGSEMQMVEATDTGVAVSPVRTNNMAPYLSRIIA